MQTSQHPPHTPGWWKWFKDFYLVYLPLRFNAILIAVIAFLFLQFPQGHDIVSRMAGQHRSEAAIVFDVCVFLLALQAWFWSRQLLYLVPKDPPASRFPILTRWIPRLLGICVFAIAFGALFRVDAQHGLKPWLRIGVLVALFIAFVVFVIVRRMFMKTPADEAKSSVRELSSQARAIFVISILGFVLFLGFSFSTQAMAALGSAVIFFGISTVWVAAGAMVVFLGHRWGMPLMIFAVVIAAVLSLFSFTDNHVIHPLASTSVLIRENPQTAFSKWIKSRPGIVISAGAKYPVFFVVTEGGGIRAAYWTAAVLTQLQEGTGRKFTDHTFAISGVSGGSLGAVVFDTMLATGADRPPFRDVVRHVLQYDALAPTLASAMGPDLLHRILPIFHRDRARALELGWEEGWRQSGAPEPEAMSKGFLEMFATRGSSIPSLFLNGTMVETGERIVTSNCHIEWTDAYDAFDELGGDLKLSTAAGMSARFPYISPAGTIIKSLQAKNDPNLKCKAGAPCGHVVDGGYFESSAAATAIQLILSLQGLPEWKNVTPYIIVIRYVDPGHPAHSASLAPDLTMPLRAVGSTMGSRAAFSMNRLNAVGTTASFVLDPNSKKLPLPLGWLLSDQSMDWMDSQILHGLNRNCIGEINGLIEGSRQLTGPQQEVCARQPPPSPMTR